MVDGENFVVDASRTVRRIPWLIQVFLLSVGFSLAVLGIAKLYWGSLDVAKADIRRESLVFIGLKPDQTSNLHYDLTVRNNTQNRVQIMGANCSCDCIRVHPLPLTIESGRTMVVRLVLDEKQAQKGGDTKQFREIRFFVSGGSSREISVLCEFGVHKPNESVILEQRVSVR